jgi:C1A family cysteine protease
MKRLKHGWLASQPDKRHIPFVAKAKVLPKYIDLRPGMPPIWDQGAIGSCTAHGVAAAHIYAQRKNPNFKEIMPSRLALYFNGRAARGWQNQDSGACIVDVVKSTFKLGVADEKLYPYQTSKYKLKPPASVYANALLHQTLQYRKVDNSKEENIIAALADNNPVVFGSTLYEGFDKLTDNTMPAPDLKASVVGGHCQIIVGWDASRKAFLVRNSWGKSFGDGGYWWIPSVYLTDLSLADDFWCLVTTE